MVVEVQHSIQLLDHWNLGVRQTPPTQVPYGRWEEDEEYLVVHDNY